jgi:hypothetical protein
MGVRYDGASYGVDLSNIEQDVGIADGYGLTLANGNLTVTTGQVLLPGGGSGNLPLRLGSNSGLFGAGNTIGLSLGGSSTALLTPSGLSLDYVPLVANAGLRFPPEAIKTSDFSFGAVDVILPVDASGGAIRGTLPTGSSGQFYLVLELDGTWAANTFTLRAASGASINGGATEAGGGESDTAFVGGPIHLIYNASTLNWYVADGALE